MRPPSRVCPPTTRATALHPIPAPERSQVWLDFDGTITRADLLDELILRYSRNDSWKLIEERWRSGQIGSRQCLEEEFALLQITPEQLSRELAGVRLDPGAAALIADLRTRHIPVAILSDGIDTFIRAILQSHGVAAPTIRANSIVQKDHSLTLRCPHHQSDCASKSAHCKCASARALASPDRISIYVGDGRSDLCASLNAEVVFAKGALAQSLSARQVPFRTFETLVDVHRTLQEAWDAPHLTEMQA
jgi:2,3-diketo-5-methylthio-1-phosphopentane phosphatase